MLRSFCYGAPDLRGTKRQAHRSTLLRIMHGGPAVGCVYSVVSFTELLQKNSNVMVP